MRLAILSACATGIPGAVLPDELVSLPSGMLQAGVAGVVASLWLVDDLSTMLLMTRFYELWQDETEPAEALKRAQVWLRNAKGLELADACERYIESWHKIPDIYTALRRFKNKKESVHFNHPYYWAAFSFTGA